MTGTNGYERMAQVGINLGMARSQTSIPSYRSFLDRNNHTMSTKRDQLQAQAGEFGCRVETYAGIDALYLRDLPEGLQGTPNFEAFSEECRQHNVQAIHVWKESEETS